MLLNVSLWSHSQACVKQMVALVFSTRKGFAKGMLIVASECLGTETVQ